MSRTDEPSVSRASPELVVGVPEELVDHLGPLDNAVTIVVLDDSGNESEALDMLVTYPGWEGDVIATRCHIPGLRVVQAPTAGVDSIIDLVPGGVTLCNGSGVHDASVSEWCMAAILGAQKHFDRLRDQQRNGDWDPMTGEDLAGSTVLIVGYGSIGTALEARLVGFEVDVLRIASAARDGIHATDDLTDLVGRSDVIVSLLPANDSTQKVFDAHVFAAMRDGALFVNAGRGTTVDTDALIEAARGGLRAWLDTVDPEPLPSDHPLWTTPGIVVTPHVAGSTVGFPRRAGVLITRQIRSLATGGPLENIVRAAQPATRL